MIRVIQLETMHIILIVALIGLLVVFKIVKDKQSKAAGSQASEKAGLKKKIKTKLKNQISLGKLKVSMPILKPRKVTQLLKTLKIS